MGVWEQKVLGGGWDGKSPKVRMSMVYFKNSKNSLSLLEEGNRVRGNLAEVER